MDKCLLFCLQGALCPEWNGHMKWKSVHSGSVIFPNCLCWMERDRCCWAIWVKCTVTSIPSRRYSVVGWFTALPGRIPQEWHSWWLRQHERFSMGFRGEPLLSKASDLYTSTIHMSRSLIFCSKNLHTTSKQARWINRHQIGTQFWSTEGPLTFTKKSLYLYRPKPWCAVTMWNAWGFPGMLQVLSFFLEMVPCFSRGGTGAGMGHCIICAWSWHWSLLLQHSSS